MDECLTNFNFDRIYEFELINRIHFYVHLYIEYISITPTMNYESTKTGCLNNIYQIIVRYFNNKYL